MKPDADHPQDQAQDQDHTLIQFLRSHYPTPPPSDPGLEEKIWASFEPIAQTPSLKDRSWPWKRLGWVIPPLALGTIALGWLGHRSWQLAQRPPVAPPSVPASLGSGDLDLTSLEAYLEETWGVISYGDRALPQLDPWGTVSWLEFTPTESDS